MDSSAELQIAAKTDGQMIQSPELTVNGQQIRKGLGGMAVTAVTRVDDGHTGSAGRNKGRTLLGMAHGDDICVAAHHLDGVGHALALGGRTVAAIGKAEHIAAELIHGSFKAQSGAGRGFKKQGRQLLTVAGLCILFRLRNDVHGAVDQLLQLHHGEIHDVKQVSHLLPPIQLSSEGLLRKAIRRSMSSALI